MNPNEPYYPDERNSGITQRDKLILDIYVKNCDKLPFSMDRNYTELHNLIAQNSIKAADILLETLKKEEKQ